MRYQGPPRPSPSETSGKAPRLACLAALPAELQVPGNASANLAAELVAIPAQAAIKLFVAQMRPRGRKGIRLARQSGTLADGPVQMEPCRRPGLVDFAELEQLDAGKGARAFQAAPAAGQVAAAVAEEQRRPGDGSAAPTDRRQQFAERLPQPRNSLLLLSCGSSRAPRSSAVWIRQPNSLNRVCVCQPVASSRWTTWRRALRTGANARSDTRANRSTAEAPGRERRPYRGLPERGAHLLDDQQLRCALSSLQLEDALGIGVVDHRGLPPRLPRPLRPPGHGRKSDIGVPDLLVCFNRITRERRWSNFDSHAYRDSGGAGPLGVALVWAPGGIQPGHQRALEGGPLSHPLAVFAFVSVHQTGPPIGRPRSLRRRLTNS